MGYGIRRVKRDGVEYQYLIEQQERTIRPLTELEATHVRGLDRDVFNRWAREVDTVPATLASAGSTIGRMR